MKRHIMVATLALALPVLAGAQPTPAQPVARGGIPVDRVVAVVGDQIITLSQVQEQLFQRTAQGLQLPTDSAERAQLALRLLNELVDDELLVQRAKVEKVEVAESDVAASVDAQVKRVRDQYRSEAEFREDLKRAGFGSPEEYRRGLVDQARRSAVVQRLLDKLRQEGKLVKVGVSEQDITEAFEKNKSSLPRRPATVSFRQIVVPTIPSAKAKAAARAKAESLLVELRKGADFEQVAKRESMDEATKDVGGDLGWNRRGHMVPEFDRVMFALLPGQLSDVVETSFGYHIIRVDRVQPAEVKARHILVKPKVDSADVARARARADSAATQWRSGVPFDTLVARYHDPDEDKVIPPFDKTQLPPSYQKAFEGKKAGEIVDPFPIDDRKTGASKFVVAQIVEENPGGDYSVSDLRETIRDQLSQERAVRRLLDQLRKETYVSIRL
jgi:peptidyl-prolyl cis-trans isomerase SurA